MSGSDQNQGHGEGNSEGRKPIVPKSAKEALRPERVPQPPQRSHKAKGQIVTFLNFLMTIIVLGCAAAIGIYHYANSAYERPGPLDVNQEFTVRSGAGLNAISHDLERKGIITDSRIFRYITAARMRDGETLKAGDYEIKAGSSMEDVAALLESGKTILYSVSIPEGLTVEQIFDRLRDDPELSGELPEALPPEGSLMPQTYRFSRGTARTEILDQMLAGQKELVDEIWLKRDPGLPIENKNEFVTLASIVEKETGLAEERSRVAAVFINRLKHGMRLQSDPTVIYGIFGGRG